jgi:hypothetical protein
MEQGHKFKHDVSFLTSPGSWFENYIDGGKKKLIILKVSHKVSKFESYLCPAPAFVTAAPNRLLLSIDGFCVFNVSR